MQTLLLSLSLLLSLLFSWAFNALHRSLALHTLSISFFPSVTHTHMYTYPRRDLAKLRCDGQLFLLLLPSIFMLLTATTTAKLVSFSMHIEGKTSFYNATYVHTHIHTHTHLQLRLNINKKTNMFTISHLAPRGQHFNVYISFHLKRSQKETKKESGKGKDSRCLAVALSTNVTHIISHSDALLSYITHSPKIRVTQAWHRCHPNMARSWPKHFWPNVKCCDQGRQNSNQFAII